MSFCLLWALVTLYLITLEKDQTKKDDLIYEERLSSKSTSALFIGLTILFFCLMLWRWDSAGLEPLAVVFFCLFGGFLFYSVNYRVLNIRLTAQDLKLRFGVFSWTVAVSNIDGCRLDELPAMKKYGGAGIHFMLVDGRYRASFNFLEFPRVVIEFKQKMGLVQDISFSTRRPDALIRLVQEVVSEGGTVS